jgi:hypothetical protein
MFGQDLMSMVLEPLADRAARENAAPITANGAG